MTDPDRILTSIRAGEGWRGDDRPIPLAQRRARQDARHELRPWPETAEPEPEEEPAPERSLALELLLVVCIAIAIIAAVVLA